MNSNNASAKGWKLDTTEETGADGRLKSVVTVHGQIRRAGQ